MAEEEGVARLEGCALGFLEVGLRLLVFGGSGFAVFVLLLHEIEGGAGGCQGGITANALLLGSKGVVVGLLDFFVEILLGFFELELLVGYLQTGLAHCIAGGIAEAVFGVPQKIYKVGMNILKYYFPEPHKLVTEFEKKYGNRILQ